MFNAFFQNLAAILTSFAHDIDAAHFMQMIDSLPGVHVG